MVALCVLVLIWLFAVVCWFGVLLVVLWCYGGLGGRFGVFAVLVLLFGGGLYCAGLIVVYGCAQDYAFSWGLFVLLCVWWFGTLFALWHGVCLACLLVWVAWVPCILVCGLFGVLGFWLCLLVGCFRWLLSCGFWGGYGG